jgi:hypothetical protein
VLDGNQILITGTPASANLVYTGLEFVPGLATAFGIVDSGAASIVFSLGERGSVPTRVRNGAVLQGIHGTVVGDLSVEGTIAVAGSSVQHIQAFLATEDGNPPTLAGTPIYNRSPQHANGSAGLFMAGDFQLVEPGTHLPTGDGSTEITVPVNLEGEDNSGSPGIRLTLAKNPVQTEVFVIGGPDNQRIGPFRFLFDTGSQVTLISRAVARALGGAAGIPGSLSGPGIDFRCENDIVSINGGANGGSGDCTGGTLSGLELPRRGGGTVLFTDVPADVLDFPGVDGILGMNLFDGDDLKYDPFDPNGSSFSFTYATGGTNSSLQSQTQLMLGSANPVSSLLLQSSIDSTAQDATEADFGPATHTNNFAITNEVLDSHLTFPDLYRQAIDRFHQNSSERSADVLGQEILSALAGIGVSPNDAS